MLGLKGIRVLALGYPTGATLADRVSDGTLRNDALHGFLLRIAHVVKTWRNLSGVREQVLAPLIRSNVQRPKRQRPSTKRTPDELRNWSRTREQIGDQLKKHYQACATEKLPPRLLALVKNLDKPEILAEKIELIRKTENQIKS